MPDIYLRRYGEATTVDFGLFNTTATALKTDAVYAAGDVKIMKDEGAEANVTTGFTDRGQGYSQPFSATELQAARVAVYIVDQTSPVWLDKVIIIETYGHPSAQHPEMGIKLPVFGTAQAGSTTACTLPSSAVATDDYYNGATLYIVGGAGIGQSRIIPDYTGSTKVAVLDPALAVACDNTSVVAVVPSAPAPTTASYLDSVASVTGNVGGNVTGSVGSVVGAVGSVTGNVGGNVVGSVASVTSKTGFSLAATGLDLITATDPGGVATTFPQMVVALWRRFFKKTTKTPTQIKTYDDAGTTVRTTQTISDDGSGNQTQGVAS